MPKGIEKDAASPQPNRFYRQGPIYWTMRDNEAQALIVAFAIGDVTIEEVAACLGIPAETPFDEQAVAVSAWMSQRAAKHVERARWLIKARTSEPIALRRYADEARSLAGRLTERAILLDSRTVLGRRWDRVAAKARRRATRAEIRLERLLYAAGVEAPKPWEMLPDTAPDAP